MTNINLLADWFPNSYPQPKLSNGSWQCGGCRTWYADWVRQCYCQRQNYVDYPYTHYPYTISSSLPTDENKDWVLING